MLLKRHYDPASLKSYNRKRNAAIKPNVASLVELGLDEASAVKQLRERYADENGLPKIAHVEVQRSGKEWRPSKKIVEQGLVQGWLSIGAGKITIKTGPDDADVVFVIKDQDANCYHCVKEKARG